MDIGRGGTGLTPEAEPAGRRPAAPSASRRIPAHGGTVRRSPRPVPVATGVGRPLDAGRPPVPPVGGHPDPGRRSDRRAGRPAPVSAPRDRRIRRPGWPTSWPCYVYLLVDPRTGRAFYVGQGPRRPVLPPPGRGPGTPRSTGVRPPTASSRCSDRIREIEVGRSPVRIDILRYGLSPAEA